MSEHELLFIKQIQPAHQIWHFQ